MPTISTLISAAIIVVVLIVLFKTLIYYHNKQKQRAASDLLEHYKMILQNNNLSFSTPELLHNTLIGLDSLHRKFLITKLVDDNQYESQVIDLDLVKNCTVIKNDFDIYANGSEKNKPDRFVEQVVLKLTFLDGKQACEIIFYKHIYNHIIDRQELEEKAKKWEAEILSMMSNKLRRIA